MKFAKTLPILMFLTVNAATAGANEANTCQMALSQSRPQQAKSAAKMDMTQAEQIIGAGEASAQIRRALQFLVDESQESIDKKVKDLRTLFWAIRIHHLFTWEYEEIIGPNKSMVFVSASGQFVWIRSDGRIFKGEMDYERDIDRHGIWNGRSDSIEEITVSSN